MFCHIIKIKSNAENYQIELTYNDNITITADFNTVIQHGIMTVLKPPAIFNQVEIGHNGRSIVWKQFDIDFCADALRLKFQTATLKKLPDGFYNPILTDIDYSAIGKRDEIYDR